MNEKGVNAKKSNLGLILGITIPLAILLLIGVIVGAWFLFNDETGPLITPNQTNNDTIPIGSSSSGGGVNETDNDTTPQETGSSSGGGGGGGGGSGGGGDDSCSNDVGCTNEGSFCEGDLPHTCTKGSDGCYDRVNGSECTGEEQCNAGSCVNLNEVCLVINEPNNQTVLTGNQTCILITADNVILDCDWNNITNDHEYTGITLKEVNNVTVKNCNIHGTDKGISIYNSSNNNITGNNVYWNWGQGIEIDFRSNSFNNVIFGNEIHNNFYSGIKVDHSNNTIIENNLSGNSRGILLDWCANNTLISNTLNNNDINLHINAIHSMYYKHIIKPSNLVNGYNVYYNYSISDYEYNPITAPNAGMILCAECDNITIRDLIIHDSNSTGVKLVFTSNSFVKNTIIKNNHGLSLKRYNSNITLIDNEILNNEGAGIVLYLSHNNSLIRNKIQYNGYRGVFLDDSRENEVINNSIIENDNRGLYVVYGSNSIIQGNNISNNGWDGVYLSSSSGSNLTSNIINDNRNYGIYLNKGSRYKLENNFACSNICPTCNVIPHADINIYEATNLNLINNTCDEPWGEDYCTYSCDEEPPICEDECSTNGDSWCASDGITTRAYDCILESDGCLHKYETLCPESCSEGACVCEDGYRCDSEGYFCDSVLKYPYNCTMMSDGCYDRINFDSCESGFVCSLGECVSETGNCLILDQANHIETLTQNQECVKIYAENVTLDCNGKTITNDQLYTGIYSNYSKSTIINCNIENAKLGINLIDSDYNTIKNSNISNNYRSSGSKYISGIYLYNSDFNLLENLNIFNNSGNGIYLFSSYNNELNKINLINNGLNYFGGEGIRIAQSWFNNLTKINSSYNHGDGIRLWLSSEHKLENITLMNNAGRGLGINLNNHNLKDFNVVNNKLEGIHINSNNSILENFFIADNGYEYDSVLKYGDGILIGGGNNLTLTNFYLDNNWDNGINIRGVDNSKFKNIISDNNLGNGAYLWASNNNFLENISAKDNQLSGLYVINSTGDNSTNNEIINSEFCNNDDPIFCYRDQGIFSNNICEGSCGSVACQNPCSEPPSDPLEITECGKVITKPGNYFLSDNLNGTLEESCIFITTSDVEIDCKNNIIEKSKYGIYSSGATYNNITIKNCQIKNCEYGIHMSKLENSTLTNLNIHSNQQSGIDLNGDHNYLSYINASLQQIGIDISGKYNNLIKINAISNELYGIDIYGTRNYLSYINASLQQIGIDLSYQGYNNLTKITANHNTHSGLFLAYNSNNNLKEINISKNNIGINIKESHNNALKYINANSNDAGIRFSIDQFSKGSTNNSLSYMNSTFNDRCIYLDHAENNLLENINCKDSNFAIQVMDSMNNNFTKINITSSGYYSFFIKDSPNNSIISSNLGTDRNSYSNHGFYLTNSPNNKIIDNKICESNKQITCDFSEPLLFSNNICDGSCGSFDCDYNCSTLDIASTLASHSPLTRFFSWLKNLFS
jgi:parallel beta-helix repeat protein